MKSFITKIAANAPMGIKRNATFGLLKKMTIPALGIALGWMMEAVPAQAAQLTITNPGFEDVNLPNPFDYVDGAPGWNLYDPDKLIPGTDPSNPTDVFTIHPVVPDVIKNNPPDGTNIVLVYLTQLDPPNPVLSSPPPIGAGLEQTLTDKLTANTNYTLQVAVGNPQPDAAFPLLAGFPGYEVELLAGGNVIAYDKNTLSPAEGEFLTSTVSYTATSNSSYLGQPLGIRLINTLTGLGEDVGFDNVRLTATPVPESNAILGILLATGIGYGIKRRSRHPVKIS